VKRYPATSPPARLDSARLNRVHARVEFAGGGCDADDERPAAAARHSTIPGERMTIKVGDRLPAGTLQEYYDVEKDGCSIGPNPVSIEDLTRGKKVVIFGLPGAFTPTCSAKHVPSYLAAYEKLKAKGVDTIACLSVNDAFVMGAWGREQHADGKVRMLADGSATYTKALGLELDLTARGMGVRCQRFSMLVDDGVVKALNVEAPGKFEVSGGDTMLSQLG
jgi:glutaredoxin/glutathione-dependent peroxiredoxin